MKHRIATLLAMTILAGSIVPAFAQDKAQKRQDDKNLMRNVGVGLGAAAADAMLKGKKDKALVLGVGAALAGKKYEDARKAQKKDALTKRYVTRNGKKVGYYLYRGKQRLRYIKL